MPESKLSDDALAELRELRAQMTAMQQRMHASVRVRHGWLKFIIADLETNPHTQYKVHLWGVIYWLVNFPLVTLLFFLEPALWLKLGIFITLVYSIYANFATDYGAMSAAMAAYGTPAPEVPMSAHVEAGEPGDRT
jgi:hypothetical protein